MSIMDDTTTFEDKTMPAENFFENSNNPINDPDDLLANLENRPPTETNHYAVLNVSKFASVEEIKDAYKRLSEVFDPETHSDPALKDSAAAKIRVIKEAFDVLINPKTRAEYDQQGDDGAASKWDIGHKIKTPQETMDDYARLAKEQQQLELENLVRSRNDITIHLDATRVFEYYQPSPISPFGRASAKKQRTPTIIDSLERTEISQLYMKNSFLTRFGPKTQLILGGDMTSRSGTGSGNITGTLRHIYSDKVSIELGTSMLHPRASIVKAIYNVDPLTFVTGTAHLRGTPGPTPLVMTFGRRVTKGTTGYMTYRTGDWAIGSWGPAFDERQNYSSLALGITSVDVKDSYQIEMLAGVLRSNLLLDRTWTVDESTRVRVGSSLSSTTGLTVSVGGDRRITQHTRLGLAFEVALSGGIACNLKVMRLGQSVTVPIMLSNGFTPKFAFWSAVVPICTLAALDLGYVKPKRRRERAQKLQELRQVHAEFIANQKKEAEEAVNLLKDSTARKTKQEQEKSGLVVIEAVYGNLNAGIVADVTIAVQALVNNSQLVMPGGHSKNHVLGFYDPCLGEKKQLKIRYEFQKSMHEVVLDDLEHVILPVRAHRLV
ncbi:hypothetical protein BGZ95_011273 [Linnemannia exigua]|uniref:J domain-containing protein n=1 Tax=Linnemannia exigua TaxID=604196 RepID=A0AAD4DA38_9FUNG|nr:hypothetical protein BGZ95_011273 [Linnemannia exigua]